MKTYQGTIQIEVQAQDENEARCLLADAFNRKVTQEHVEDNITVTDVANTPSTFKKITVGFVVQTYIKNQHTKEAKCVDQEFIAGDQCDFEDMEGETIDIQPHIYQPYNMVLRK